MLLLDEPTANLDPVFRDDFLKILQEFVAEYDMTILMATHLDEDISELEKPDQRRRPGIIRRYSGQYCEPQDPGKDQCVESVGAEMNTLMNGMDTSSGLKLSLRWRSKTAEKEDQLDTRELVELLKKDYRLNE